MTKFNRARADASKDYKEGVFDGMALEADIERRFRARKAREGLAYIKQKAIGWDGINGGFYFWPTGWSHLSLGIHICLTAPNVEIHLPFGFIRIGMHSDRKHRRELAQAAGESADA